MATLNGILAELKQDDPVRCTAEHHPERRTRSHRGRRGRTRRKAHAKGRARRGTPAEFLPGIESPGALRLFIQKGVPGIFFGPGEFISEAHLPNERVPTKNLIDAAAMFARVVCNREGEPVETLE
jgi:acetylornithine deacetylase/succinyl-diaminopimelate desuccinylase-like protein